ncbi:TerB family tellurite resistance protein [Kiloniella laminariae]|uniref:TerB family tellurite resistance protein n=1 Tax=Kiloniella laminariae TaxID=454162 RepID=A0ABT4LP87_9PROT|nr:TerB family tellurite resistance protein [Kiloniella laminariae]MCZ4282952.1 TerB family tellurite resistance protein [Kiloniella laminariae]
MHILLAILGALGGLAYFIWRVRATTTAARDVIEAADDIRSAARRVGYSRKLKANPLDQVDDNRLAAAGIMAAFARMDGDYTRDQLDAIRAECERTFAANAKEAAEIAGHARWLMEQSSNRDEAIRRLSKNLRSSLTVTEKRDLLSMVERIARIEGNTLSDLQTEALARLKKSLF